MKYCLEFYADNAKLLNNYKKLEKSEFYDIINNYTISRCPENFKINLRERNFFIHNIDKIKKDYQKQLSYYLENSKTLYKTSNSKKMKDGVKKLDEQTTMYEKDLCKELWFASFDGVKYPFDIIDIQVPLKSKRKDKYGEIDILGVDIIDNVVNVYLIEVKPLTTKETLLEATIESITYKYIINANKKKFLEDLKKYIKKYDGMGEKANLIKKKLLNEEKLKFNIKSLILVPEELYDHSYSKMIFKKYRNSIDYYTISYDLSDLEYRKKDNRIPTLFKKGNYPKINKYKSKQPLNFNKKNKI